MSRYIVMDAAYLSSDSNTEPLSIIDAVVVDREPQSGTFYEERRYFLPPLPGKLQATEGLPKEADPSDVSEIPIKKECGIYALHARATEGQNCAIGFLDTGIDSSHPDIQPNFAGFKDFVDVDQTPKDPIGHGTGVVGVACGMGVVTPKFEGVAPLASIVMARVIDDDGWANEIDIIKGLEWLLTQNVDIINMSLGFETDAYGPLEMAMEKVKIPIVVAAGNAGPKKNIMAPGNVLGAMVVASCDQNGDHSIFSSLGPARSKRGISIRKPDLMAWGENVPVPRAKGTSMGTVIDQNYVMVDGTSFASPFVAGCLALYMTAKRSLDGYFVAAIATANDKWEFSPNEEGYGRIDAARMIAFEPDGSQVIPPAPKMGCLLSLFMAAVEGFKKL